MGFVVLLLKNSMYHGHLVHLGQREQRERRPPIERVRALAPARPRVVLLPKVAGAHPLAQHVAHERLAQLHINLRRACLRRPGDVGVVVEPRQRKIVEVDPDGPAPVGRIARRVLPPVPHPVGGGERTNTVGGPETLRVPQEFDGRGELGGVGGEKTEQQREEGHIPKVRDELRPGGGQGAVWGGRGGRAGHVLPGRCLIGGQFGSRRAAPGGSSARGEGSGPLGGRCGGSFPPQPMRG
eukprot:scaffold1220_cov117-Isochrysis_galbana.AAC.8